MIKQTTKNRKIFVIGLLTALAMFSFILPRVLAAGGPDNCYNSYTGYTYECGTGAPSTNVSTTTLVLDIKGSTYTPTPSNKKSSIGPLYSFTPGNCYAYQSVAYDGFNQSAWVQQTPTDCTSVTALETPNAGTAILQPDPTSPTISNASVVQNCSKNESTCNLIGTYINPLIKFLNVSIGLIVVIFIVLGGIQYSSAGDNPEAIKAARKRITNAILGLVAYFLLYAFLNFIIPGGI